MPKAIQDKVYRPSEDEAYGSETVFKQEAKPIGVEIEDDSDSEESEPEEED